MSSSIETGGLSSAKGGPATEEGKEVVRWNATRHGIRSPAPVVPGVDELRRALDRGLRRAHRADRRCLEQHERPAGR